METRRNKSSHYFTETSQLRKLWNHCDSENVMISSKTHKVHCKSTMFLKCYIVGIVWAREWGTTLEQQSASHKPWGMLLGWTKAISSSKQQHQQQQQQHQAVKPNAQDLHISMAQGFLFPLNHVSQNLWYEKCNLLGAIQREVVCPVLFASCTDP